MISTTILTIIVNELTDIIESDKCGLLQYTEDYTVWTREKFVTTIQKLLQNQTNRIDNWMNTFLLSTDT